MAFNDISDLSGTIQVEGDKIAVDFLPTVPQQSQATVRWNIPSPIAGCADVSHVDNAYSGIVILASETPLTGANIPEDGVRYDADPTLNPELHVGDTIGGALVVGAFYEAEEKARGEALTTEAILNDYNSDGNFYVGAYAVNGTLEYHKDGIRAYSDKYGDTESPDSPSCSVVVLNDNEGTMLTDGTNLDIGRQYGFEFDLNTNFPNNSTEDNRITIQFDGAKAQTYGDMLDEINAQFREIDNPLRSPNPPNTGSNLWNPDTQELQRFDGTAYQPVTDIFVNDVDPSIIETGTFWFDTTTNQLNVRNEESHPSTELWDHIETIALTTNPTMPSCDQIWFDGTTAYKWSGTTWCKLQTFSQDQNPALMQEGSCGQFWYRESDSTLFKYNTTALEWDETFAIFWPEAPDALLTGTYWFSTTERVLRSRIEFGQVKDWNLITNFVIGEVKPVIQPDLFWYRESTNEFFQVIDGKFELIDVLEWHESPSSVSSCELWWDSTSEKLHEWDVVNLQWDEVASLTESEDDPLAPEDVDDDSYWLDTKNNMLMQRGCGSYVPADEYIDFPTDPTNINESVNVAWFNPDTGEVQVPSDMSPTGFQLVDPLIRSDFSPTDIPIGTSWFDTSTDTLNLWNGLMWIAVPYTTQPIRNTKGDLWLNTTDNILRSWNGKAWVPADSKITAELDSKGNLLFKTRDKGSCIALLMLIPGTDSFTIRNSPAPVTHGGVPQHIAGFQQVYSDNPFDSPEFLDSNLREDEFLFNEIPAEVQSVILGSDGVESLPSYAQLGVGTDGTPDERRALAHAMKIQLGYPTVEVELTPEQLDYCMNRAFDSLRKRSDIAYRRGFYLLDIRPGVQNYRLTNKKIGFNRIVTVMGAFRQTGAFGAGFSNNSVFDQKFAQQLYGNSTAGGFDMTSLYLSQQYLELIEMMFATKLNYHFNESDRTLNFHQDFHRYERILLDTSVERTEQDMFKDRWVKSWIERYSLAHARLILAEIRGKYAALPGAGGGVSLNASDLLSTSAADFQECYQQLDEHVASNVEQFGSVDIVMG